VVVCVLWLLPWCDTVRLRLLDTLGYSVVALNPQYAEEKWS
jgi:hypothetical protein